MKRIAILIVFLMTLFALAACNGEDNSSKENNGVPGTETSDPSENGQEEQQEEQNDDGTTSNGETSDEDENSSSEEAGSEGEGASGNEGNGNGKSVDPDLGDDIKVVNTNGELKLDKKYFNVLATVDGKPVIQNPDNILVMANKQLYLPSTYVPKNLVKPNVPFSYPSNEENYMQEIAAKALEKMFEDAKKEGIHLIALSGYRSYQTQTYLFQRYVDQMGFEEASKISAQAGTSEHQTGLTMDITADSVNQRLLEEFESTKEGIWLRENAHKYGFIMRYPKGKEHITGYSYEPWHFRYVGKDVAKIIYENNWTLEEFFDVVKEI